MNEIYHDADFFIGSRHVKSGTIPGNWGFMRRLNSLGGNFVARYVTGIYRVRDCTAGFRAIRTTVLGNIDFSRLRVQGYAFQFALIHTTITDGAIDVEVPVDFIDRIRGESKLGASDIFGFVKNTDNLVIIPQFRTK